VFPESKFNEWFPSSAYNYDSFLKAAAKFPAFCNETNNPKGYNLNDTCKSEIAAFFAHIKTSSNALTVIKDPKCATSTDAATCGFKTTADLNSPTSSLFYGRGPLALQGDLDYARFSSIFYEGFDRRADLINNPNRVADDGYHAFASAMYRYMVPKLPAPSPHNVIAGFYIANATDISAGLPSGFGATIQVLSKNDCAKGSDTSGGIDRANNFKNYMTALGLTADTTKLSCASSWGDF